MELITRIRSVAAILIVLTIAVKDAHGLQGVPTWICLGIKSPFIEFRAALEVLSNASISLNVTDEVLLHQQRKKPSPASQLNPFISNTEMDTKNATSELTQQQSGGRRRADHQLMQQNKVEFTESSFTSEMNNKEIVMIEERENERGEKQERKYIIPMALKNPTTEPKKSPIFKDSSTNIDDLKRHILMLQNLTKNDASFQSKFVVFPNLQGNKNETPDAITTTQKPMMPTRNWLDIASKGIRSRDMLRDSINDDAARTEKITIVPQVFLQNDQTPMNDESEESRMDDSKKEIRVSYARRKGAYNRKMMQSETTTTPVAPIFQRRTTMTTTMRPVRKNGGKNNKRKGGGGGGGGNGGGGRRNKNRLNRKKCQDATNTLECTLALAEANRNNKTILGIRSNFNETHHAIGNDGDSKLLSRPARSHYNEHQQQFQQQQQSKAMKEFLIPAHNSAAAAAAAAAAATSNNQTAAYKENIDLNPDLCYRVGGLTYGQQKLCVLHTNIMPAISRGARSAIQECQHQFRYRRWNCSTVEDDTVFGPVTSIGSPEMAFIHALAAAGVASFIARSCRDGQLTSCGCSRSSRPKQLHEDWTWGGCGDDLEFGYKFAQNFIDIREKERKRGTRGLVSVPQKLPNEKLSPDGSNDTTTDGGVEGVTPKSDNINVIKQEELLELQEKITKEIQSSKLQENEMQELQEKISREILNSKIFNLEQSGGFYGGGGGRRANHRLKSGSVKARTLMNLHNNEAGRRAVIKKARITCKCHGVSGSCSLITCWQQLTSMREIGDYLREKYEEATQVKLNKRGRLHVKDPRFKVPSPGDLVYLDESPDWCRNNRQLQWPGTHGRVCNKTSSGLDGCGILCCGRGYNTKKIVVRERCNCKFHWCCHVKCETCVKNIEEYTCK